MEINIAKGFLDRLAFRISCKLHGGVCNPIGSIECLNRTIVKQRRTRAEIVVCDAKKRLILSVRSEVESDTLQCAFQTVSMNSMHFVAV